MARHLRANSDPLSRGGAFPVGASGQLSQETNPFELGFAFPSVDPSSSQRRARSTSPLALVPGAGTPGGTKLPPLSLMDTPGGMLGSGLTPFGWPNDSLRTGPLSPALLTGPSSAMNQAAAASLFTPSTSAALGVGSSVSFPPPSPATAALFAMMTHATPVTAAAPVAGPAPGAGPNGDRKTEGAGPMAGMEGGGPRPHEGPNEGNAFDASFARATSSNGREGSGSVPPPGGGPGPNGIPLAPPNQQRSSLGPNMAGPPGRGGSQPPQSHPQQGPYGYPPNNGGPVYAPSSLGPGVPPPAAFGGAQNPLYLLSQASQHPQLLPPGQHVQAQPYPPGHGPPPGRFPPHHQTMPQPMQPMHAYAPHHQGPPIPMGPPMGPPHPHMQDDAVVAAAALSGLGGYGMAPGHPNGGVMGVPHPQQVVPPHAIMAGVDQGQSPATSANGSAKGKRGGNGAGGAANKKRKSNGPAEAETAAAPATTAAKGKAAPAKKGGKKAPKEEEDNSDDEAQRDEDMGPLPANHADMTEEEKRKNFLERNRQAALKCRQRKKAWLASLQTKVESLTQDNEGLQATVTHLTDEIASLRAILAAHRDCPTAQGAMGGGHQQQGQY